MLEVVDQVAQEREPSPRLYQMLLGALRTLAAKPSLVVVPAFFWKVLALEGLRPELDALRHVRQRHRPRRVRRRSGRRAVPHLSPWRPDQPDALALIRRILGGGLAAALDEPASPTTHEVEVLATRSLEHHLERRIRSMTVLDHG